MYQSRQYGFTIALFGVQDACKFNLCCNQGPRPAIAEIHQAPRLLRIQMLQPRAEMVQGCGSHEGNGQRLVVVNAAQICICLASLLDGPCVPVIVVVVIAPLLSRRRVREGACKRTAKHIAA